jgi:hypothetical protein
LANARRPNPQAKPPDKGKRLRKLKTLGAVSACVLALISADCSGSKPEKLQFDPVRGEVIAHAALIGTVALPSSGWSITNEDPKESDDSLPDSAGCKALRGFQDETKALDKKSRVARAKRVIQKPAPSSVLPTEVTVEIEIYREAKALLPHLKKAQKLVDENSYGGCLEEVLGGIYKSAGLTATTKRVSASLDAPKDGFAFAEESEIDGLRAPLHFENYGWIVGNAKVTVSLSGSKDTLTPELVKAAVEKTQAALLDATDAK